MTNKIQQSRRAAFREIFANAPYEFCMARYAEYNTSWPGNYVAYHVECAWNAFNAALDCVVIELPDSNCEAQDNYMLACERAIESTSLGIKVK